MSKADPKIYECRNPACTLGSRKDPGRFAGGMTADQAFLLTADPDAPHGDGVCPNCGQHGKPAKED